jgi:putative membrane protein
MRHIALALAVAGLALAVFLFAREDVPSIFALVVAAGPGLVLAALCHVPRMFVNARAWQRLLPAALRPSLPVMARATWIKESINSLLPVARVGGEIVVYRIVRRPGGHSEAAASLIADTALSVLSQACFALLGLTLLFAIGRSPAFATQLLFGVLGMIPLGAGFLLVQRAGVLSAITHMLDRLFAGPFGTAHAHSLRLDQALQRLHERHRDVAACFAWQFIAWVLGSVEIWVALRFLGQHRSVLDAITIEALIQAVSSAAFLVPAALGVQEGAFIVIGAALGIDASTALALATARRLRDVIIFFPGLFAWQWVEARMRSVTRPGVPQ